jgi:hypothetical protein
MFISQPPIVQLASFRIFLKPPGMQCLDSRVDQLQFTVSHYLFCNQVNRYPVIKFRYDGLNPNPFSKEDCVLLTRLAILAGLLHY